MVGIVERVAKFVSGFGSATPRFSADVGFDFEDVTPVPVVGFDELRSANPFAATNFPARSGIYQNYDGEKFFGGFGATRLFQMDYWTLRNRSSQLFRENLYARGLIRRLVTNEINTGLSLVSSPNPDLIPLDDEQTTAWAETTENRFGVWATTPALCDYQGMATFGEIQRTIRREAYVDGDILVILRSNEATGLPMIELVRGEYVQTPAGYKTTNKIAHGVELDPTGRQVAYHVLQDDGTYVRIAAFGERSNRRIAWLSYGCDKRYGEVRGEPLLSIILQSLKDTDRYRDAALRKAVVNAMVAMFIEKGEDVASSRPLTGGAMRRDAVTTTDPDGTPRSFNFASGIPGITLDELNKGEKPVGFKPDGTDVNFPLFEAAMINAIAWANEMPGEILQLAFQNNYSASQAAVNEFRMFLARVRTEFGEKNCTPVYGEWLLAELISRKITAPGLLQAMNDPKQYDVVAGWFMCEWPGAIKPSTDIVKQANGYGMMVDQGWVTNEVSARELTGTKFRTNIRRLTRENQQKAAMMRPLLELRKEFGQDTTQLLDKVSAMDIGSIAVAVADEMESRSA